MEDEKENLCEQLALQTRAVKDLEHEIQVCQDAKKELLEVIVQMQQSGFFLANKRVLHPSLLKLEILALEHRIKACHQDLQLLSLKSAKIKEDSKTSDEDSIGANLLSALSGLFLSKAQIEADNEALKADIESIKNNAIFVNGLITDRCDVDQVVTESIMLRDKLDQEMKETRQMLKAVKRSKRSVKKMTCGVTSLESLERPLRLLQNNRNVNFDCQEYLRKVNLALLEELKIKDTMMDQVVKHNLTLAKRLTMLTNEKDLLKFYNPNDQPKYDKGQLEKNPIV